MDKALKGQTIKVGADLLAALLNALESAPHKHRIDFQAYWDWYDGPRNAAAIAAHTFLRELGQDSARQNSTG